MDTIIQQLKALKPDEPADEIEKDVAALRQQKPGITDDQILQAAKGMVQGGAQPAGAPTTPISAIPASAPTTGGVNAQPAPSQGPSAPLQTPKSTDHPAMLAALEGLAGLGDAISRSYGGNQSANALGATLQTIQAQKQRELEAPKRAQELAAGKSDLKTAGLKQAEAEKSAADLKELQDPASAMSRARQKSAGPILKAAGYTDEEIAGIPGEIIESTMRNATSFADAKARMAALKDQKNLNVGLREDQQQDRLEESARKAIQSLRGDKSLSDAESKRDASITVYNTIDTIKKQGRMPSKLEYYDLLGQMWKARTGATPTDQAMRDLDSKTFKGDLGKAMTYFTGSPAGATTENVLDNIQSFAKDSGLQADKFHEGYMKVHLIKPKGLSEERWQPIVTTGRGQSFAEATGAKDGAPAGGIPSALPTITSQQDYDALPSGAEYIAPDGTHKRKK